MDKQSAVNIAFRSLEEVVTDCLRLVLPKGRTFLS